MLAPLQKQSQEWPLNTVNVAQKKGPESAPKGLPGM